MVGQRQQCCHIFATKNRQKTCEKYPWCVSPIVIIIVIITRILLECRTANSFENKVKTARRERNSVAYGVSRLQQFMQEVSVSQIRIFSEAGITGVITRSTRGKVDMWIGTAKCLGMIGGRIMSLVCGRNRSGRRMTEYQEAGCSRGWMRQTNVGRR